MKKINIIKVYDASNAHEAKHLIGKPVFTGMDLEAIYFHKNKYSDVINILTNIESHYLPFMYNQVYCTKYIAEFEEVEDGK